MKFELSNPSVFKTVIESLSIITDECGITFSNEEVNIRALSKDHTTFMMVDLDKHLFDEYDCNNPSMVIVDIQQLSKIMKRCKNTDLLLCNVDDGNIIFTFKDEDERCFKSRLIDNEYESPRPPIIDYPVNITLPTNVFNDSLGDLRIFSDIIKIITDEDYIRFKGEGQYGNGEIKYIHGEQVQNVFKSSYSIMKLTDLMKAKGFSEQIQLSIGNDLPLKLTFKLVTNDGKIEFLVAPRISDE